MKSKRSFEIQGHRGCRGLMPENTIEAFKKAVDLGVDSLELDVVISKDRKVVVSHDPFFNPQITTRPDGTFYKSERDSNLYLMDYEGIRQHDVGQRGNADFPEQAKIKAYKPLLSEVFEEVSKYIFSQNRKAISYNIEIKSIPDEYHRTQPSSEEFVDLVLAVVDNGLTDSELALQSFDFKVLQYLHFLNQEQKKYSISALIEPEDNNEIDFNLEKLGFKPDIWSPNFTVLSKNKVSYLHKMGIKVIPWTVNNLTDMDRMYAIGCHGIITDYPDRAIKYIKK